MNSLGRHGSLWNADSDHLTQSQREALGAQVRETAP